MSIWSTLPRGWFDEDTSYQIMILDTILIYVFVLLPIFSLLCWDLGI